ncbi:transporter substrate-binding domain-containing protein [Fervidobacterium sp.]
MRIIHNFPALILIVILFYTISFALTIGYYDNYPLIYEHNGQPKGLFIDVLERADILRNQKVKFVYGEFSNLMERLKNGEIDLLVAVAHTPEREELYTFNKEPVIMNWGVLVSLKSIENFMLLDGKVIAVNKGDVYYQRFKDLAKSFGISLDYIEKDTYEEVIQAVDSGEAVGGVVSRLSYIVNSAKYPKVLATPFIFSPVAIKFATKRGADTSVLDNIDKTLALMKANGELDKLFNEYFGLTKQRPGVSVSTVLLLVLIVIYVLTILIFNHLLKKEKYRYEAALEGYKRTLSSREIADETRNVYNYTFG